MLTMNILSAECALVAKIIVIKILKTHKKWERTLRLEIYGLGE